MLLLILISGFFYYNLTGNIVSEREKVFVSRIVDGDTIEIKFNNMELKARLKGINTPEKGMLYFEDAKEFLKSKIENKNIEMVSFGGDKYGRLLVYVFYFGENINEEILGNGFGSLYYYGKDDYYNKLRKAEEFARLNKKGIWKNSPDANCVKLVKLEHDEPEKLVLENICNWDIKVLIKDDATHIYRETLKASSIFEKNFSHIWNTGGDSLFVWDGKGLLIFYRY
jgi:endonuclease YncB( thermonuclease family)